MASKPRLDLTLRQTQRLGLSAGVLTGLAVLRMPAAELAEALAREAEANPFLLPGLPPPSMGGYGANGGALADSDASALVAAPPPGWQESLLAQLGQRRMPPEVAALAKALVAELDERGWLETPLDSLAREWDAPSAALEAALSELQSCEPAGIGGRDLGECLALQLVAQGLTPQAARATLDELPRFGRRDWAGLARVLNIPADEARQRGRLLRRLGTDPVAGMDRSPGAALRPDLLLIRTADGTPGVTLARDHLPQPRIDRTLARQLDRARQEGDAAFGADLLARARALVRAVDGRQATLLRIGDWLVRRQDAALTRGPGALRPALRRECAADLGLHPATVGRAVAGKALLAEGRLWLLGRLFTRNAPGGPGTGEAGGDAGGAPPRGAAAIAHRIGRLIAGEDPQAPLSDDRLRRILATEGVDMARRTVAKYRHDLRIPSAPHRRRRG